MSAITDLSNTNFTTEKLIHNIPTLINQTKNVSKSIIHILQKFELLP
jgi:hypothetical protein